MSAWPQRRPRMMVLAGVAAIGIALAGCSGSTSPQQSPHTRGGGTTVESPTTDAPATTTPEAVLPASLTSSVKSAATEVAVDTPVSVTAANGTLKSVVFSDGDGKRLPGTYNHARTTLDGRRVPRP